MKKSPLELANEFISPFDENKIARGKNESPRDFFNNKETNYRKVQMSPNDYFKLVSEHLGTTPEKLMKNRQKHTNEISVDDIRKKMRSGVKFDTPWIQLGDSGEKGDRSPHFQEGLHRMLAAGQEYGMDTKFPIYLGYENDPWNEYEKLPIDDFIKYYDKTRLDRYIKKQEEEKQHKQEIYDYYKEMTAEHFKVPLDKVTPELIKKYQKYEDDSFEDLYGD